MTTHHPIIPYSHPSITSLEVTYATDAAQNGWGSKCYDYIYKFESLFKELIGVKYAIATSSCTGALQIGMHALGIGQGDEVILADTNWIATASPIVHLGAKPIFVDILPDTWCLDPDKVRSAITPRTKAIIAVHMYGNLCDMSSLALISQEFDIPIIEDAAEAIGSYYHGQAAGSMGKFGAYSFHGTKTITTGEGGMFVTNDSNLYEAALTLSNHGRSQSSAPNEPFLPDLVGYKYKLSNVQAAIGCAQLERVQELVTRKQQILELYLQLLKQSNVFVWGANKAQPGCTIGAWMPTLVLEPPSESSTLSVDLRKYLKQNKIDARPFFAPLSSTKPFVDTCKQNKDWWACQIHPSAINLPSAHDIKTEEMESIVRYIQDFMSRLYAK